MSRKITKDDDDPSLPLGTTHYMRAPSPATWATDFHDRFAVMRETLSRVIADLAPPTQSAAFWRMRALGTLLDACSQTMAAFAREGAAPAKAPEPEARAWPCDCVRAKEGVHSHLCHAVREVIAEEKDTKAAAKEGA